MQGLVERIMSGRRVLACGGSTATYLFVIFGCRAGADDRRAIYDQIIVKR
jgi:hypothetical protein